MARLKQFATDHPLLFALLIFLVYFFLGALFVGLISLVTGIEYFDIRIQSIGSLAAISILLVMAWRFGWLRAMGVASLADWRAWLIAVALFIYIVFGYWLIFFGEISLNLNFLVNSDEATTVFWRQLVVGFVEEILFRGIILYVLVRVWGGSKLGLVLSVLLSAFLFAIPHVLQALASQTMSIALVVVVEAFVSGIWYAVYVLLSGTLWPVVLIHAFSNMAVQMKVLTEPGWSLSTSGLLAVILIQLPLVLLGLWLLRRRGARLTVPFIP